MANATASLSPEAIAALREGRLIDAIKITRATHRLGLKEAKDAVDAYVASQPALRLEIEARQKEGRGALGKWLIVVIVVVAALIYFLGVKN
jgi:hypothetical protein